jgi:formylglycine-generating enzyme required for sulfatase activity
MKDDEKINNSSPESPEKIFSGCLPNGQSLKNMPDEFLEEQKSIQFGPKKIIAERFEILEIIGFGVTGAVYKVKDHLLDGEVRALKIMLPSLVRSYEARQRFIAEIQRIKTLKHDGIAAFYDIGEDREGDFMYLILEMLEGQNLEHYLASRGGTLEFNEACDIILQVCDILSYAYEKGFAHRGINTRNIFDLPNGKVKLLDFGLSKLLSPVNLTRFSMGFSADGYIAPEQLVSQDVDNRADIYSIGAVFHMLLVGHTPEGRYKLPSDVRASVPGTIDRVIEKCLEPRFEDRYKDVIVLAAAIRNVLAELEEESMGSVVKGKLPGEKTLPKVMQEKETKAELRKKTIIAVSLILAAVVSGWFIFGLDREPAVVSEITVSEKPRSFRSEPPKDARPEKAEPEKITQKPKPEKAAAKPKPEKVREKPRPEKVAEKPKPQKDDVAMAGISDRGNKKEKPGAPLSDMILVKGGCFEMGDVFGDGYADEKPVHEVCLDDFYIDKYEVTQREYRKVMGGNPSHFKDNDLPVDNVTWTDAKEYCEKTGGRLPTEAEWEYAARGRGKNAKWAGAKNESGLKDYAWYDFNSRAKTHPVGKKMTNALGVYDMSGNVYEWVADWFDGEYYAKGVMKNPKGPEKGIYRVLRGGSWNASARYLYTTVRMKSRPGSTNNNNGFRCSKKL